MKLSFKHVSQTAATQKMSAGGDPEESEKKAKTKKVTAESALNTALKEVNGMYCSSQKKPKKGHRMYSCSAPSRFLGTVSIPDGQQDTLIHLMRNVGGFGMAYNSGPFPQ